MIETWYVLEDGSVADPRDVARDDAGRLRHKDGRAVAYRPHGPRSRSVDVEAERAKIAKGGKKPAEPAGPAGGPAPAEKESPAPSDRQMKASGGAKYKTR